MNKKRIVITGLGAISPLGIGAITLWDNVIEGKSCIKEITKFPISKRVKSKLGGEVNSSLIKDVIKDERIMRSPFITQLAVGSAILCLNDANVKVTKENSAKIGIFFGTCNGAITATEKIYKNLIETGPASVDPLLFSETVFNAPASAISIKFGITGPYVAFPMSSNAGGTALYHAIYSLQTEKVSYALVCATDEINQVVHEAYFHLGVLSPCDSGEEGSRPFDKERNSFVLSEGGAALMLEPLEQALERNAVIYGEIIGWGSGGDGYRFVSADPTGKGLSLTIKRVVNNNSFSVEEIDYVSAFAPSLKDLDLMETRGVKEALGRPAFECPISSIKGAIGETNSPSLLFNIIVAIMVLKTQKIPPTINYKTPDPACDLDYVPNKSRDAKVDTVLVTGYSWGSIYNAFIIRKFNK